MIGMRSAMRYKSRQILERAEAQIQREYDREYDAWLKGLSDDQLYHLLDTLLASLAQEGLGPDLHGRSLGDLPWDEKEQILDQADLMRAKDPDRAGQLHSDAILATVNRYQNWPGIERWLIPELAQN